MWYLSGFLSAYCIEIPSFFAYWVVIPSFFCFFFLLSAFIFFVFPGLAPITLLKCLKASTSHMISVHTL